MLKTVNNSLSIKTLGCAVTYRSGIDKYNTCPTSCPLKPKGEAGAQEFDHKYAAAVSAAVPRRGHAWIYTHFNVDYWSPYVQPKGTTFNLSCTSIGAAVEAAHNGINAVLDVPKDTKPFKTEGIQFAICPASKSKKVNCGNCGGQVGPLCAIKERKYVIMFPHHQWKKKEPVCYGEGYHVSLNWTRTTKENHSETDSEKLRQWVKKLPSGTLLRHHVVGDLGHK